MEELFLIRTVGKNGLDVLLLTTYFYLCNPNNN